MTWDEIRDWLLANGWEKASPSPRSPPRVFLDCRDGRMLKRDLPGGHTVYAHMLIHNVRVGIEDEKGRYHRLITSNLKFIKMEGGMPRGMGLQMFDIHS